jgi:hypothetical protein
MGRGRGDPKGLSSRWRRSRMVRKDQLEMRPVPSGSSSCQLRQKESMCRTCAAAAAAAAISCEGKREAAGLVKAGERPACGT